MLSTCQLILHMHHMTYTGTTHGENVVITTDPQNKTTGTLETRTIHRSAKKDIPPSIIATTESKCISKHPLKRALLRGIHIQLDSCGLLTMLLKQRVRPVSAPENPAGYKVVHEIGPTYHSSVEDNASVASIKTEGEIEAINLSKGLSRPSVFIPADNIELWQHDEKNL